MPISLNDGSRNSAVAQIKQSKATRHSTAQREKSTSLPYSYHNLNVYFTQEYDRLNPVTKEEALKEFEDEQEKEGIRSFIAQKTLEMRQQELKDSIGE